MESFWGTLLDIVVLFLKVTVIFYIIRLILMALGIHFEVPYVDDFLWSVYSRLFAASPRIAIFQ